VKIFTRFSLFLLIYLFTFLSIDISVSYGQSQIRSDDFETSTFPSTINWLGNTEKFQIVNDNGNKRLQLNADNATSKSYIALPDTILYGSLEFEVNFNFTGLSSSNRLNVYFGLNTTNPDENPSGYALQAGETGTADVFKLYKVTNGSFSLIASDTTLINDGGTFRVKIDRDTTNLISLAIGRGSTGALNPFIAVKDSTFLHAGSTVFQVLYTSTRVTSTSFDSIVLSKYRPFLLAVEPISLQEIRLDFTDKIQANNLNTSDFIINPGAIEADNLSFEGKSIRLHFSNPLPYGDLNLQIPSISDSYSLQSYSTSFSFANTAVYAKGDLIINEFMHNPPSGLVDFVEIKNTSDKVLNIGNWIIRDNNSTQYRLPAQSQISPNDFVVLAADTSSLFNRYGTRNYIQLSSFPGFNNTSKDQIRFYTDSAELVDSLEYEPNWGISGYSLERRSASLSAIYLENWGPSPNSILRGSPGLANEIEADETAPVFISVQALARDTVQIVFSETVVEPEVSTINSYSIADNISISEIILVNSNTVKLVLSTLLDINTSYSISVNGLSDLFGNTISSPISNNFEFIKAEIAAFNEIAISEFMYDTPTGYTEFIELFNPSNKVFDLINFTYNDNSGTLKKISNESIIFRPGEYIVLVPNVSMLGFFPDAKLINMGSSFSSLNNTGDHIVIRNAESDLIDSLSYNSTWGGSKVSLERRDFSILGSFKENWGNSPNALLATMGKQNEIMADITPPQFMSVSLVSADTLILTFSERLSTASATLITNFTLDQDIRVTTANLSENGTQIRLGLNQNLDENRVYTGTIFGISDVFGNIISGTLGFTVEYVQTQPSTLGDILITEFMFDPPSAYSEYIELKNVSDKYLDLSNWTYSDNSNTPKSLTEEFFVLKPSSYIVLAANENLKSFFPEIPLLVLGSNFASLNNTSDQILIKNNLGQTLDSLMYSSSWGGTKLSLERRSETVSSIYQENWGNSSAALFGSPGSANTVLLDSNAPELIEIRSDSISVSFIYSERLDFETATASSISTSLNRTEINRTISNQVITVEFAEKLNQSTTFSVTIGPQKDIFGNESISYTTETKYVILKQALVGDLILTEFVYKASDTTPEFIEIYNSRSENIDLRSFSISDSKETQKLSFKSGYPYYIEAQSYLILTTDEGFTIGHSNRAAVSKLPSLNDTGTETIVLKTAEFTADSLVYSFPLWEQAVSGQSFERRSFTALSIDPTSWGLNPDRSHTAGAINSVSSTIPSLRIEFAGWVQQDTFIVVFNKFIQASDTINVTLSGIELANPKVNGNTISYAIAEADFSDEQAIYSQIELNGDLLSSAFPTALRLENSSSKPLILTEILFNPLNTDDVHQGDFIEFFNPNSFAVQIPTTLMKTFSVSSGNQTQMNIESKGKPLFLNGLSYGIIYADSVSDFESSRLANYFALSDTTKAFRVDRTSLSLSSSNSAIVLKSTSGVLQDSVRYVDTWHNPNAADVRGRSLERILLSGGSNDPSNWSTSGNNLGGTPGFKNTLYLETGEAAENELLITPNPFSPDLDGFEDNTTISWNLDGSNYLITATIYDRYGRKVRNLAEQFVAGKEGSIIWDGKRDDGTSNRIGIYILVFKARDSNNGKEVVKKGTIVIATKL